MSFKHIVTQSYTTDEGVVISAQDTRTGGTEVGYSGVIAPTTDNVEVDIGWAHSAVQSLELYSSQALTIKTNSSSAPTQTIALAAGQAVMWTPTHLEANPVTADVTKLFLSNDTANSATVQIRVLVT